MTKPTDETAQAAMDLVERVRPLFAGQPPMVLGAALADLLATWLAGHFVPGNERATRRIRKRLLRVHYTQVLEMTPTTREELAELDAKLADLEAGNEA